MASKPGPGVTSMIRPAKITTPPATLIKGLRHVPRDNRHRNVISPVYLVLYTIAMKSKAALFVLAAVLLAGTGLYLRSQNIKHAQAQADKLVATDNAAGNAAQELTDLKSYVKGHMGAAVSFTLQASYDRAAAAAKAAAAASAANSQIYADAQRLCSGKSDSITQARCNQDYLSKHLVNVAPAGPITEPKLSDYQYNLRAPFWTPDLAGALLLGAVAALVFVTVMLVRGRR